MKGVSPFTILFQIMIIICKIIPRKQAADHSEYSVSKCFFLPQKGQCVGSSDI